jgi:hypothetical protein
LAHGCTLCTGVHLNLVLSALVVCLWYCVRRNMKHKLNRCVVEKTKDRY